MTPTLTQIAELAAQGKGDRVIARELGITRHQAREELKRLEIQRAGQQELLLPVPAANAPPAAWAAHIAACWRRSVQGIFDTGRALIAAKEALPHGDFGEMVKVALPFTASTAQRLMAIAADPKLSNPAHVQHLPPSWGTLYELTKLDDDTFHEAIEQKVIRPDMERREISQSRKATARTVREHTLGLAQRALPRQKFGVIVADPEWRFEPWSRETGMDRAADNHYPTSCTEVIASRDVPSIAAPDCVLYLWATIPMLPHALLVMAAWGFDYKSHHVWGKDKIGMGYWNRENHELLLVGTRGKIVAPAMGTQLNSLVMASRGAHSAKPEIFLDMIERHFPTCPKIELNRRGPSRPGWDSWGNEAEQPEPAPSSPVTTRSPGADTAPAFASESDAGALSIDEAAE